MTALEGVGTVVSQAYSGHPQDISLGDLATAQTQAQMPVLSGWSATRAFRDVARVVFENPGAVATVNTLYAIFSQGIQTVQIEVLLTPDPYGRAWVDSILSGVALDEIVPLGRGVAEGPSARIDAGDRLITVFYQDGLDQNVLSAMSIDQLNARIGQLTDRSTAIMQQLA